MSGAHSGSSTSSRRDQPLSAFLRKTNVSAAVTASAIETRSTPAADGCTPNRRYRFRSRAPTAAVPSRAGLAP